MDDITPLMTIAQAAALLGLHPETLRRDIRSGKLEAYRRPRATRISRPALQAYLEQFRSPMIDAAGIGPEERRSVESGVEVALRIAKLKAMVKR
ncbi:hypothetical protein AA13595_0883 [Gluconacetobacter johannae DSM 13595]|uniref:Helix-turn-helix domain-containing protein n=1 Tax=Gluconacetobacter johannae TaxID=112140 RepID=A0A7W4P6A3_9PROT|nr:helix-turn-helix domain-containing protein [Gluconacetobacter johannae]MBB2177028.1 helix-turn-helix domain-containing protein [Gluconacetobacter johannae]GBQ82292.1 hypothetical protein AA13595_0883 [Gluconacetobacter johannae DSM 13595]